MTRYKILIEYDGNRYKGWQRQPKGKTVEEEIESALSQILQEEINIAGQGRTDSGVHAEGQVAHFDSSSPLDKNKMLFALLGVLPRDIAVWDMEEVDDSFHSRFDATSRQYRYQVVDRPSPLWERYAEMVLEDLDLEVMKICAQKVLGQHDFESFTRSKTNQNGSECEVNRSEIEVKDHLIVYRIRANRFVHHMVRRLIGTMLQVGKGKKEVEYFEQLLADPRQDIGGHGASAKGLILEKVTY